MSRRRSDGGRANYAMMLRNRGRTALTVAASITAAALLLTGCAGSGPSGGSSKTLTYWSMWTKAEPQAKVLQSAADAFQKSTGIHVDIRWVGRQVLTTVSADLNGGSNLPDLVDQDAGELAGTFSATDSALGLQPLCSQTITGEAVKVCDVLPTSVMNRYQTKSGQPMMIPYELISSALWYNASQSPSLTSNPPTTWSDFTAFLQQEKAAGRAPLALDADQGEYTSYWWTYSAVRHGGPGAALKAVEDKTGAGWDNPDLLAAAKDLASLVKAGDFTPGYTGSKWPAQQSNWANGQSKADLLLMGSWAPSETAPFAAKNPVKFQYASMPYPQVSGGKGNNATEESLIGFAIPKKAPSTANAEQFIRFFLNKKYLAGISQTALNLTPRSDIAVPAQLADLKKQVEAAGKNTFQTDDGVTAKYPQFGTESYYPLTQKLLSGQLGAPEFIQAMKTATVSYWKNKG